MNRLVPLLCILSLALTGCTSILERDYVSVSRHMEYPVADDSSILQAESDQGLVSALLYFVMEHADTGVIHLTNYVGDVEKALEAACAEVMEQDPIGAYALNGIEHQHTRIVSYYEVTVTFDYAHTEAELDAIVPVSSSAALSAALAGALSGYSDSCVLRINRLAVDEVSLLASVHQLWLDTPLASLARPEVRIKLYPNSGSIRVAEFTFDWPEDPDDLSARRSTLEAAALRLLQDLNLPPEELTAETLLAALAQRVVIDPEGGAAAYHALVEGTAAPQGVTLALCLLCQLSGLETTVVEGRLNGEAAYWLIASTAGGFRHFDPAAEAPFAAVDEEFQTLGYEWSMERYPACLSAEPAVSGPPFEESGDEG